MSTSNDNPNANALNAQIENLKNIAMKSTDSCVVATLIATTDKEVTQKILDKQSNYVWKGLFCAKRINGMIAVVFNFECPPNVICLVKPWFAAIVDLEFGRVYGVQDPYCPETIARDTKPCSCSDSGAGRPVGCVTCQHVGHYGDLVDALKKAKDKGAFNSVDTCYSFCDKTTAFAAYLTDTLGLASVVVDAILAIVDQCGHCACKYDIKYD